MKTLFTLAAFLLFGAACAGEPEPNLDDPMEAESLIAADSLTSEQAQRLLYYVGDASFPTDKQERLKERLNTYLKTGR